MTTDNLHQLIMRNESIMYQSAIGEVLTRKRANRQDTLPILTHRTTIGDWIEGRSRSLKCHWLGTRPMRWRCECERMRPLWQPHLSETRCATRLQRCAGLSTVGETEEPDRCRIADRLAKRAPGMTRAQNSGGQVRRELGLRMDRRLTRFAGPEYDAPISFGLPSEPGDCR